jgi:hypothetical protein
MEVVCITAVDGEWRVEVKYQPVIRIHSFIAMADVRHSEIKS